jgi:hypothetical protein
MAMPQAIPEGRLQADIAARAFDLGLARQFRSGSLEQHFRRPIAEVTARRAGSASQLVLVKN